MVVEGLDDCSLVLDYWRRLPEEGQFSSQLPWSSSAVPYSLTWLRFRCLKRMVSMPAYSIRLEEGPIHHTVEKGGMALDELHYLGQ